MKQAWMVYICGEPGQLKLPRGNFVSHVAFLSESIEDAERIAKEIFEKLCALNSWTPGWPDEFGRRVSTKLRQGKAWLAQDKDGNHLQVLNVEPIVLDHRRFYFDEAV